VNEVRREVNALWDAALLAWERGMSTEDYEPAFAELLDFALSHPEAAAEVQLLTLEFLGNPSSNAGDLVGYLMHTLRDGAVRREAASRLAASTGPVSGEIFADVVNAFDEDWSDRDLYQRYSGGHRGV
jgi:hypothetical protein